MKRIAVLVVAFVIAFTSLTFAGITELNLSEMTTDELIELRNTLNEELQKRMSDINDYIYTGNYVVGVDIAPGRYLYTNLSDETSSIMVYEGNNLDTTKLLGESVQSGGHSLSISLDEGNLLVVKNAEMSTIVPYDPSWTLDN